MFIIAGLIQSRVEYLFEEPRIRKNDKNYNSLPQLTLNEIHLNCSLSGLFENRLSVWVILPIDIIFQLESSQVLERQFQSYSTHQEMSSTDHAQDRPTYWPVS